MKISCCIIVIDDRKTNPLNKIILTVHNILNHFLYLFQNSQSNCVDYGERQLLDDGYDFHSAKKNDSWRPRSDL